MKNFKNLAHQKAGFTLAEILIILVIVGVVSAVVIGTLIITAQKTSYVTSLQKANSSISSAVNRSQVDNSTMETWNYTLASKEFTQQYFSKYLNIISVCDTNTGCFADSYTKKDGSSGAALSGYYTFILNDGIAMGIKTGEGGCSDTNPSVCATILIDVNSTQGPNQWGKDLFALSIYKNLNAVVPLGAFSSYNDAVGKWVERDSDAITENCLSEGEYCAAKIANEGWEMNY